MRKYRPLPITIIVILLVVYALIIIVGGFLQLIGNPLGYLNLNLAIFGLTGAEAGGVFLVIGIILILFARGLALMRMWAWWLVTLFMFAYWATALFDAYRGSYQWLALSIPLIVIVYMFMVLRYFRGFAPRPKMVTKVTIVQTAPAPIAAPPPPVYPAAPTPPPPAPPPPSAPAAPPPAQPVVVTAVGPQAAAAPRPAENPASGSGMGPTTAPPAPPVTGTPSMGGGAAPSPARDQQPKPQGTAQSSVPPGGAAQAPPEELSLGPPPTSGTCHVCGRTGPTSIRGGRAYCLECGSLVLPPAPPNAPPPENPQT